MVDYKVICNETNNPTASKSQKFKMELKALLEKYNASIGVDIEGDTHGLSYNFEVEFRPTDDNTRRETVTIGEGYKDLDASDIKL